MTFSKYEIETARLAGIIGIACIIIGTGGILGGFGGVVFAFGAACTGLYVMTVYFDKKERADERKGSCKADDSQPQG